MIKTIYYRGYVDFCNYECSYCPFSKKKKDEEKLKKDEISLEKLYNFVKNQEEKINLMITPYGEALYQELYQIYIARLSTLENINKLGIQTNFSLDLAKFEEILKKENAKKEKIMIWATYHSEFAKMEDFVQKVNKTKLNISVGIVADTKNNKEIKKLRDMLKADIYLWINAMDRKKNSFDNQTINYLSQIDPMFLYEFSKNRIEGFEKCNSYNNKYIDMDRYLSSCFFKKKRAISSNCNNHKKCDCYLGYSNFEDNKLSNFFGENKPFRIPEKRNYQAIFIDIDGVLTNEQGNLILDISNILCKLKNKTKIYIATARSFEFAQKKLKSNFSYFSGGVFSDGTFNIDFEKNYIYINQIKEHIKEKIYNQIEKEKFEDSRYYKKDEMNIQNLLKYENYKIEKRYTTKNTDTDLLRLLIPTKSTDDINIQDIQKRVYKSKTYLQDKEITKLSGITKLIQINNWKEKDILFISDNIQDKDVFEKLKYTISPIKAEKLSKMSYYKMNLDQSIFIID